LRFLIIVVAGLAECALSGGSPDTASGRDWVVVAGPPAVPTTLVPAETLASSGAPAASPSPTPSVDSIRGTVSVTGTSFEKHVMLAERGTRRRVEVTGPLATLIGRVAGTEITAVGQRSGTRLEASRFAVRVVDGQPAIDGTLRSENGSLFIVTTDGARTRIVAPPPPFAGREGARVWITGDPARSVASFGFIDPPR
jgi:hypothetical protein